MKLLSRAILDKDEKQIARQLKMCIRDSSKGFMITVSSTGMVVSLKMDLRFPIPGQQGHGGRIIHNFQSG